VFPESPKESQLSTPDAPDAHVPDGTDRLVKEIREEVAHLVKNTIE